MLIVVVASIVMARGLYQCVFQCSGVCYGERTKSVCVTRNAYDGITTRAVVCISRKVGSGGQYCLCSDVRIQS